MLYPKFLWDSALRGETIAWSGASVAAKGPENAVDWRDFSYFEAGSGNLDFTMSVSTAIDAWSIFVANFTGTGSETIELQYESSPSVFTSLGTVNPVGGKLTLNEFTEVTVAAGRRIRFVITVGTGTLLIRQLVVGKVMEAEQGQYVSMTYPDLLGGLKLSNVIAQNGSILGRSVKREERMGQIELDFLSPAWVRGTWEPFARHLARYPFIYQPDPRDNPDVVAFSAAENYGSPSNSNYGDRLSVKFKVRNLVADELLL